MTSAPTLLLEVVKMKHFAAWKDFLAKVKDEIGTAPSEELLSLTTERKDIALIFAAALDNDYQSFLQPN